MNMKKRAIAFVVSLFLLVALCIIYIFSELYTESEILETKNTDAVTFKEEYESLNNRDAGNERIYRSLDIKDNNPFIYATAEEIADFIDKKETFVVYFGFNTCPWCRSVLPYLIESAEKNDIKKIYYVDVKNIRDTYILDEDNKPVRSVEGSKGYYSLLEKLDNVLKDYAPLTYTYKKKKKTYTKEVKVGEKRIYAPNVVVVKEGVPLSLKTGISDLQTDSFMELSQEMKDDMLSQFNELFLLLNNDNTCPLDGKAC